MRRLTILAFLLSLLVFLLNSPAATAAIAANECTLCHGTTISDFTIPLMSRGAQCAVCHESASHASWKDPVTGRTKYAVNVPGIGYFRNTTSFNDVSVSLHVYHSGSNSYSARSDCIMCHGVASCLSCHQNVNHEGHGTSSFTPSRISVANGTVFTSTEVSCATSKCHQTLPAIVKTNSDGTQLCVNCHPRFGATAKDLNGHDPLLTETKHGTSLPNTLNVSALPVQINCGGCHTNNLAAEHTSKNKDCSTCHNNSNFPAVQTVVKSANNNPANRTCDKCHFNVGVIPAQTEHTLFHIATKSNNLKIDGGPHTDCNTCHDRATPLTVSANVYGAVYQKTLAELASMSPKNYSCLDCHTGNSNPKAPLHKAQFDGQATDLLDIHADCSYCHTPGSQYAAKVDTIAAALKNDPANSYSCTDCHTSLSNSHNAYYEFGTETINLNTTKYHRSCNVCHGNSKVSGVITLLKGSSGAYNCNQCHNGTAAKPAVHITGKSEGIVGYHPATSDSTRCDKCHGEANFAKINIPTWPASYDCTNCHDGTIAKTALHQAKDSGGTQYTTIGLHPTCATCHDSSDANIQSVIAGQKGTNTAYLCADCHSGNLAPKHNASWADGAGYETTGFHKDCSQCHGNANNAVTDEIHKIKADLSSGAISTYGCSDCHGTVVPQAKHSAKLTANDLISRETTQYHAKLGTSSGGSCFACHNNTQVSADLELAIAKVKTGGEYLCTDCHKNKDTAPYKPLHMASLGNEQLNTVNQHPACTTCHTTSIDDKIATLKGKTDYNCEDCHTNLLDNHKSTTNLADIAFVNCSWCHSSSDPAYANNNLIGIHVKPNVTLSNTYTCNVCHSDTSPVKAQIAAKKTGCADCHDGVAAPVKHPDKQYYPRHVVNQFPAFMQEYSPNCATCHKDNSLISLHSTYYVGCNTCHTTEAYKPAVVSLNTDCSGCHNSNVNPAIDMANYHKPFHNANTALYPATAACLNCHAKDNTVEGQSLLAVHKKNSGSTVTCDTCHGTTARQAVKDAISAKNISCQACHGDAGHNHPVAADGYMVNTPVDCGQCHSTNTGNTGAELAAVHQQAADRGLIPNFSCATCHNANFEGTDKVIIKDGTLDMKKNGTISIYCTDCHNGNLADSLSKKYPAHDGNHINSAGYGTYKGSFNGQNFDDSGVDCSKCHASLETKAVHDPSVHSNVNCNSCHQSTNPAVKAVITGAWSRALTKANYTCASCHNTLPYKHQPEHLATGSENVTCNTCHDGTNAPGSFNAPSGSTISVPAAHTTNGSVDCNKCHSSTNPAVAQFISDGVGKTNVTYTCTACHDSIAPKHVKQHNVTSYLNSGNASCSGCHNADISVLHSAATKATLNCDTCHGANPALPNTKSTILVNLSSKTSTPSFTCESCHTNAASGHSHPVSAAGYDAAPNVDCSKCHATNDDGSAELYAVHQNAANAGKITNFSCSTCHNSTFEGAGKPIVKDGVLDMKQNGTAPIYCTTCHNGTLADALGTKYSAHNGNHLNSTGYGTYNGTYNGVVFDDSGVDCSKCHTSLDTKSVHDPDVHPNINCNSCHQSTNASVQSVITSNWSRSASKSPYTCSTCHSTLPYMHQPEHVATSADDASLDCSGCHVTAAWNGANAKLTDVHNNNCNTCHSSTNSIVNSFIAGQQGKTNSVYACEGCHITGGAQPKEAVHKPEHKAMHSATGMNCSSCHSFNITAGTAADISTIHKNSCATCHGANAPDNVKLVIAMKKGQNNPVYNCEDCHGAIHLGWEAKHKPTFPTVANTNCANCHDNYLPNEHQRAFPPMVNTAVAYQVFRSTSSTGPWTLDGTTTATSYADTGLAANTAYYYKLVAYDGKPNYSGNSSIISVQTLANTAATSTVTPTVQTSSGNTIINLNYDAQNYTKIQLKMSAQYSVSYRSSSYLIINPYLSNGTSINTSSSVNGPTRSSSGTYTETIDVTNIAKTMNGFGWMKFNVKPSSGSVTISNVQVILTQNAVSGGTATNPPGTLASTPNDTIAPTAPTGIAGTSKYYDRIDLTWTASTDTTNSTVDVCALCHSSTARQQVNDAITGHNANCSACHPGVSNGHNHIVTANGFEAAPNVACSSCHATNADGTAELYTLHQNAAEKGEIANFSCITCHNSTFEGQGKAIVKDGTIEMKQNGTTAIYCSTCHTGVSGFPPSSDSAHKPEHTASSTDNTIACAQCHFESAWSTSNANIINVHNSQCNTCHTSTNTVVINFINSKKGQANTVYNCEGCHTSGGAPTKETIHKPEHLALTNDCARCHFKQVNGYTDITGHSSGCKNCHSTSVRSDAKAFILSKIGLDNKPYDCAGCHPNGMNGSGGSWGGR